MDIIFLAEPDELDYLDASANPKDSFVCMDCQDIHVNLRAQIYASLMGTLFDEGLALEEYVGSLTDAGPTLSAISESLVDRLASLDEDQIEAYARELIDYDLIASADMSEGDLGAFLFPLVNLARTSVQETGTRLYVFTR